MLDSPTLVTLYVVRDWPLCSQAREWLREHEVTHVERDVANDFGALRAMYVLTKQRFVPLRSSCESTMRFSRAQIIGAILLLAVIWLVIAIRLIISRG